MNRSQTCYSPQWRIFGCINYFLFWEKLFFSKAADFFFRSKEIFLGLFLGSGFFWRSWQTNHSFRVRLVLVPDDDRDADGLIVEPQLDVEDPDTWLNVRLSGCCSTVVEHLSHDQEVVGSNPAVCRAFFLLFSFQLSLMNVWCCCYRFCCCLKVSGQCRICFPSASARLVPM